MVVSRFRFAAENAPPTVFPIEKRRQCWVLSYASGRWTVGASHSRGAPAKPHQSVTFWRRWTPVDKWITCGLFSAGQEAVEDAPGQERSLGDERGEVSARGGAGGERRPW